MGEWYMKVVFDSFDSFQLAEFDFFLRNASHTRVTLTSRADPQTAPPCHRPLSSLCVAYKWPGVDAASVLRQSELWFHVHSIVLP